VPPLVPSAYCPVHIQRLEFEQREENTFSSWRIFNGHGRSRNSFRPA
jgi:hypothetical protein